MSEISSCMRLLTSDSVKFDPALDPASEQWETTGSKSSACWLSRRKYVFRSETSRPLTLHGGRPSDLPCTCCPAVSRALGQSQEAISASFSAVTPGEPSAAPDRRGNGAIESLRFIAYFREDSLLWRPQFCPKRRSSRAKHSLTSSFLWMLDETYLT